MTNSRVLGVGAWWVLAAAALVVLAALGYATWWVHGQVPYRIDVDVYRMGAQAWRDGHPLYGDVLFVTRVRETPLPFTYPPIAAVLFTPFTWVSLPVATATLTVITTVLLVVSVALVLTALGVGTAARRGSGPGGPAWWRSGVLAGAIVAAAIWLGAEPILSNYGYGQINVVLMTLVIADCLPRRTPWPRGVLVGVAMAVKLTPAVFLLYFLLRRDTRAALWAVATFATAVAAAFLLAPTDSREYWTRTLFHTNRIGDTAVNTNQNFAGVLARLGITGGPFAMWWAAAGLATLALTVWAVRRLLRDDQPTLALMCVALFGLLVSPVSWSHHWVWALPTIVTLAVRGYRRSSPALAGLAVVGLVLLYWAPLRLLGDSGVGEQLLGAAYVWWALAVLVVAGLTAAVRAGAPQRPTAVPAPEPTPA
ncbi:MAG TPA: glycosyltransferase 87 family protein [Mycobacterium sp.]|nr:glycosyltransferase 87 family protein [Mycobacterium sp.]